MANATDFHSVALALLARPAINNHDLGLLHGLAEAADLLWHFGNGSPNDDEAQADPLPNGAAFANALDQLAGLHDIGATSVLFLLQTLGARWRVVPRCALRVMADALSKASDQGCAISEARHVAWWFEHAKVTKTVAQSDWTGLVAASLKWQANDEVLLRQAPMHWAAAISADVQVSGFELVPITSTQQLVQTTHHKGVLCSVSLARACCLSEQVWFYARPKFGVMPADLCLFGLTRADQNSPWETLEAYAPPSDLDVLRQAAASVGSRANARARLAMIRNHTVGIRSTVDALFSWSKLLKPGS